MTAAVLLVALASAGLFFYRRAKSTLVPSPVEVVPLTGIAEMEDESAFSPDGKQVAFVAFRGEQRLGIFRMEIGGDKPFRLTNGPLDCSPAWSPDGRAVAFARIQAKGYSIFVVPAQGG